MNLAPIVASITSALDYALKFAIESHATSLVKRSFLVDTLASAFVERNALQFVGLNHV